MQVTLVSSHQMKMIVEMVVEVLTVPQAHPADWIGNIIESLGRRQMILSHCSQHQTIFVRLHHHISQHLPTKITSTIILTDVDNFIIIICFSKNIALLQLNHII